MLEFVEIDSDADDTLDHKVFVLSRPDGSLKVFGVSDTWKNNYFLTTIADRFGNAIDIERQGTVRRTIELTRSRGGSQGWLGRLVRLVPTSVAAGTGTFHVTSVSVSTADGQSQRVLDFTYDVDAGQSRLRSVTVSPTATNPTTRTWNYHFAGLGPNWYLAKAVGPATAAGQESVSQYWYVNSDGTRFGVAADNGLATDTLSARSHAKSNGLLASAEGPGTHQVEYLYGATKRVERTIEHIGTATAPQEAITDYRYDVYRGVTWVTQPNGLTTEIRHSTSGQAIETVTPDGLRSTAEFDNERGLQIASTSSIGLTTRIEYDELNRPILQSDANGLTQRTTYEQAAFGDVATDDDGNAIGTAELYGRVLSTQQSAAAPSRRLTTPGAASRR